MSLSPPFLIYVSRPYIGRVHVAFSYKYIVQSYNRQSARQPSFIVQYFDPRTITRGIFTIPTSDAVLPNFDGAAKLLRFQPVRGSIDSGIDGKEIESKVERNFLILSG